MPNIFSVGDLFSAVSQFLPLVERRQVVHLTRSSLHEARSSLKILNLPTGKAPIDRIYFSQRELQPKPTDPLFFRSLRDRKIKNLYDLKPENLTLNIFAKHYHRLSKTRYEPGSPVSKSEGSCEHIPVRESIDELVECLSDLQFASALKWISVKCEPFRCIPFAGDPLFPECAECDAEEQRQFNALVRASETFSTKLPRRIPLALENATIGAEALKNFLEIGKHENQGNCWNLSLTNCFLQAMPDPGGSQYSLWSELFQNVESFSSVKLSVRHPVIWHTIFSGSTEEFRKRVKNEQPKWHSFRLQYRENSDDDSDDSASQDFTTNKSNNLLDFIMDGTTKYSHRIPKFPLHLITLEKLSLVFSDEMYLWPSMMKYVAQYPKLKELKLQYSSSIHPLQYRSHEELAFFFDETGFRKLENLEISGIGTSSRMWSILAPRLAAANFSPRTSACLRSLSLSQCDLHPSFVALLLLRFPKIKFLELSRTTTVNTSPESFSTESNSQSRCLAKAFEAIRESLTSLTLRDSLKSKNPCQDSPYQDAFKILTEVKNLNVLPCFSMSPSQTVLESLISSFPLRKLGISLFRVPVRISCLALVAETLEEIQIEISRPKLPSSCLEFSSSCSSVEFPRLKTISCPVVLCIGMGQAWSDVATKFCTWISQIPNLQSAKVFTKFRNCGSSTDIEATIEEKEFIRRHLCLRQGSSFQFTKV